MNHEYDDFDRALLRAGRRAKAPSGMRTRALSAAAAMGGAASVAATKASALGSVMKVAGAALRVTTLKLTMFAALATTSAGAAYLAGSRASDAPAMVAPGAVPPAKAATSMSTSTLRLPDPPAEPGPLPPIVDVVDAPAPRAPTKVDAPRARPTVRAPIGNVDAPSGLGEELGLVEAARKALADGAPSTTLRLADEHAARFPSGAFVVERDVLRIDALVAAERWGEAASHARAFLVRHPSSSQAVRIAKLADRIP